MAGVAYLEGPQPYQAVIVTLVSSTRRRYYDNRTGQGAMLIVKVL